jgi:hypothetical protein
VSFEAWSRSLSQPVDVASLAAFRILFGLVMACSTARFVLNGWVSTLYLEPLHHFSYPGLSFVEPWPPLGMYAHFAFLFGAALCIAIGWCTRLASLGFCLGFTYLELIDQSLYLNHYYLVTLLAALLALLPAGRAFSLDAWLRPERRVSTLPRFALLALQIQVGLVYVFAGVSKLNRDWLVEAQPLRIWLAARSDLPLVGPWLAAPAVAVIASWAGCWFDLTIVGFLSWRRTRSVAMAAVVGFHAVTGLLFPIGIFPWLMTVAATLLLKPEWPRALSRFQLPERWRRSTASGLRPRAWEPPGWLFPVLALHCCVQSVLPLRQHLHRSNSAWTLEGFNFAWNVMVAEKAGSVSFRACERADTATTRVEPRSFLAKFQEAAMAQNPELVRQAALFVADGFRRRGRDVAVYADAFASLNGRPAQRLVDPAVDLTRPVPRGWILPLE